MTELVHVCIHNLEGEAWRLNSPKLKCVEMMSRKQIIKNILITMFGRLSEIIAHLGTIKEKDIAHVAIHGTADPHDMLPGTEGDSDNQKVPPSRNSTFILPQNVLGKATTMTMFSNGFKK